MANDLLALLNSKKSTPEPNPFEVKDTSTDDGVTPPVEKSVVEEVTTKTVGEECDAILKQHGMIESNIPITHRYWVIKQLGRNTPLDSV